jgi:hypothetical protein
MTRIGRVWIFSLLWANLSVLLVVLLIQIAGNGAWGPRDRLQEAEGKLHERKSRQSARGN